MHVKIKYGSKETKKTEEEHRMLFEATAERFPHFLEKYTRVETPAEPAQPVQSEPEAQQLEEIPLRKGGWEEILYSKTNEDFLKDVDDIITESLRQRKQPTNDNELRKTMFGKLAGLANGGVLIRGGWKNNEFQRNSAVRVKWI